MNHIQTKKAATDKMAVGVDKLTEVVGSTDMTSDTHIKF